MWKRMYDRELWYAEYLVNESRDVSDFIKQKLGKDTVSSWRVNKKTTWWRKKKEEYWKDYWKDKYTPPAEAMQKMKDAFDRAIGFAPTMLQAYVNAKVKEINGNSAKLGNLDEVIKFLKMLQQYTNIKISTTDSIDLSMLPDANDYNPSPEDLEQFKRFISVNTKTDESPKT